MLPMFALATAALSPPPVVRTATPALRSGLAEMEWLRCGEPKPGSPPIVLVHGTFHGAWCWAERWMQYLADAGLECHAVSLRGTSGSPAPDQRSVKISEHVSDIRCFVEDVLMSEGAAAGLPPILVGHSFGGATVLKYLEAGGAASGAALVCSVPPSGNGPMTFRFLRRSLSQAWLITRGFALKTAAKSTADARALFFDDGTPDEQLAEYLPRFEADSRVGLDLGHFNKNLPSKAADGDGRATWLRDAPPLLVLGAERDFVVDREGVEETARFLGVAAEFVPLPHDVMLAEGWEAPAERLARWVKAEC